MFAVGDRVKITRKKSVDHLLAGGLGLTGVVVELIPEEIAFKPAGRPARTVKIKKDDTGYFAYYAPWELRGIK